MSKNVYILLGSPNSPTGVLSEISISRLKYCLKNYQTGDHILCTGGWGKHFNTSEQPHAVLTKKYLIENGVPENAFLDSALSANTVDDAVKIKPIISKLEKSNLTVITSDYHVERVELIFNEILENIEINYIGVKNNFELDEYQTLVEHEKNAIKAIIKNGLYY